MVGAAITISGGKYYTVFFNVYSDNSNDSSAFPQSKSILLSVFALLQEGLEAISDLRAAEGAVGACGGAPHTHTDMTTGAEEAVLCPVHTNTAGIIPALGGTEWALGADSRGWRWGHGGLMLAISGCTPSMIQPIVKPSVGRTVQCCRCTKLTNLRAHIG